MRPQNEKLNVYKIKKIGRIEEIISSYLQGNQTR
jgi:hypothetical protein